MAKPAWIPTLEEATPPQGGFVRREQLPELRARQKNLNRVRKSFLPSAIKKESTRTQLYIFNVGPKLLEGNGASFGRMMIQPCAEGAEYSTPLVIPGMPHEWYRKEGNTMDVQFHGQGEDDEGNAIMANDPGFDFACQVIGGFTMPNGEWNGAFLPQGGSLEKFGVGISRTWPPPKEDVALAKQKLMREYALQVQKAREAHAHGRLASLPDIDDCFVAARALGLNPKDERWMEFSYVPEEKTAERTKKLCPECAEEVFAEAKKCRFCGTLFEKK